MNILITGGAGFIASHLTKRLLLDNHRVICIDNFELGRKENLQEIIDAPRFTLIEGDVSNLEFLSDLMKRENVSMIYHLAANSDIQKSAKYPGIDFSNTFSTTYSVLEGMRRNDIKKLFFASTSAVYGEKVDMKLKEDIGNLAPISYYGSAKLASEVYIQSYSYMNEMEATIFRFPNVIGPKLTHGVIFDFINKLRNNPTELQILGDGTQKKPYIYVLDLIEAIIQVSQSSTKGVSIYNVGVETSTTVKEIADMVCEKLNLENVKYSFTGGNRGWKGDVPQFTYDLDKIHNWGWYPSHTSNEAVQATLDSII